MRSRAVIWSLDKQPALFWATQRFASIAGRTRASVQDVSSLTMPSLMPSFASHTESIASPIRFISDSLNASAIRAMERAGSVLDWYRVVDLSSAAMLCTSQASATAARGNENPGAPRPQCHRTRPGSVVQTSFLPGRPWNTLQNTNTAAQQVVLEYLHARETRIGNRLELSRRGVH